MHTRMVKAVAIPLKSDRQANNPPEPLPSPSEARLSLRGYACLSFIEPAQPTAAWLVSKGRELHLGTGASND